MTARPRLAASSTSMAHKQNQVINLSKETKQKVNLLDQQDLEEKTRKKREQRRGTGVTCIAQPEHLSHRRCPRSARRRRRRRGSKGEDIVGQMGGMARGLRYLNGAQCTSRKASSHQLTNLRKETRKRSDEEKEDKSTGVTCVAQLEHRSRRRWRRRLHGTDTTKPKVARVWEGAADGVDRWAEVGRSGRRRRSGSRRWGRDGRRRRSSGQRWGGGADGIDLATRGGANGVDPPAGVAEATDLQEARWERGRSRGAERARGDERVRALGG